MSEFWTLHVQLSVTFKGNFFLFIDGLEQNFERGIISVDVSVFRWCCLRSNHRAAVGPNPDLQFFISAISVFQSGVLKKNEQKA